MSTNVIRKFKKFVHTALLLSPAMWELKYRLVDLYRATMGVPHEADPRALRLFPSLVEGVFLDIGAIRGQSIRSILRMYPNARVVAFEPNLVLASKVTEEFVANAAVDVRNVALGDRNMTFCRHVPYYRRCMLDGLASLDLDHAQDWLVDSRLFFFDQRHMRVTSFDVEARTLDSLGLEPFFVKIDVQGVEPQVLMGGARDHFGSSTGHSDGIGSTFRSRSSGDRRLPLSHVQLRQRAFFRGPKWCAEHFLHSGQQRPLFEKWIVAV